MVDTKTTAKPDDKKPAGKDPMDPANQPGNTGNAATMTAGIKTEPTEAEDEEAKAQAKAAGETADELLGEGSYRKASKVEADAIRDGASLLGKEAVVVTDEQGHGVVARRGMTGNPSRASATNPALMANNAVASAAEPPEPPKPVKPAGKKTDAKTGKDILEPVLVTDLHGTSGGVAPSG